MGRRVHIHTMIGQHAPCGVKVSSPDFRERVEQSAELSDLDKVTCETCQAAMFNFVKYYLKAKRAKKISWEESAKAFWNRDGK